MNFLDGYIEHTMEQESPQVFHEWTALTILSTAIKRHVYINRGFYNIYPNLYTILVASTAKSRKSTAANIGMAMLKAALGKKLCHFHQKESSPEALIQVLSEEHQRSGIGQGMIYAEELAQFLAGTQQDGRIVSFLTDIYSCQDEYEYHSKGGGTATCSKIYPTFLACTTVEWIKDSLPKYAVAGGFTGRIVFVHDTPDCRAIPFPEPGKGREALIQRIQEVHGVTGAFEWSREAKDWFTNWYTEVHFPQDPDAFSSGFHGRKPDTLLKIAMILALSNRLELVLREQDVSQALTLLNRTQVHLPTIMKEIESTFEGQNFNKVMRAVQRAGGKIGYSELLRSLSYSMNARQLQEVLDTMVKSEKLVEVTEGNGKKRVFRTSSRHQSDT